MIHRIFFRKIALISVLFILGISGARAAELVQYSTIEALLSRILAGEMTLDDLLDDGDFGIGTFNDLDGEMIVLEGVVYQVRGDGTVHQPSAEMKTPYAAVCEFDEEDAVTLGPIPSGLTYEDFLEKIDAALPSLNLFYAVKVEGTFQALKARSVYAQKRPYPLLADIVKTQSVFEFTEIKGTLVGLRCPAYVKGINVPGYHFHFISADKQSGGHVLGLTTGQVTVSYVTLDEWEVRLPDTPDFLKADLGQDISQEIKAVETSKK